MKKRTVCRRRAKRLHVYFLSISFTHARRSSLFQKILCFILRKNRLLPGQYFKRKIDGNIYLYMYILIITCYFAKWMHQREGETGQKIWGYFIETRRSVSCDFFEVLLNLMVPGRCFWWFQSVIFYLFSDCVYHRCWRGLYSHALYDWQGDTAALYAHRNGFCGFKGVFRVETVPISVPFSQIVAFSFPRKKNSGTHGHNS